MISSSVRYRLSDRRRMTVLDWDGGCDAGTVPSWDAGSILAARLQDAELELVRSGPKSRIQRTEGACVSNLGRRELIGSMLGRRDVST